MPTVRLRKQRRNGKYLIFQLFIFIISIILGLSVLVREKLPYDDPSQKDGAYETHILDKP